ncbi:MAG: HAMP domain-containing histidine kinase [Acetobacteraceae bacterium]|nr:HAMP domain-containing histidine kinase [Acetobacteraceae bacterium]
MPRAESPRAALWRTTPFRLAVVFGALYAAGIASLLALIYFTAASYVTRQMDEIVLGQAQALASAAPADLPKRIEEAEAQDRRHVNYYGLFSAEGVWITGNVRALPPGGKPDGSPRELKLAGLQPGARSLERRLPWGEILFVGYDAKVLTGLRSIIVSSLIWGGALTGLLGLSLGAALSLAPLRRIRDVQDASRRVMEGDLNARLPVSGRRDEIDMLATIANAMTGEAARLLAEVKGIGDNVAHDLRTPLTRLRALLYRVQQEGGQGDDHPAMIDQALAETDRLLTRFRALQRIGEIDRMKRRAGFGPVRLRLLLEELADLYRPLAEDHGLDLEVDAVDDPEVLGDRELLFEALGNLIDNAVKFTPSGGQVRLRLRACKDGPRLEVVDSGPGVAADERDAVLERFRRGRSERSVPGSGLGLSIVSAVARLHQWRLTLADAGPGLRVSLDAWPHEGPK